MAQKKKTALFNFFSSLQETLKRYFFSFEQLNEVSTLYVK